MACLRQVFQDYSFVPGVPFGLPLAAPCVREFTGRVSTPCLRAAIWQYKLLRLQDLFEGGTSDDDERKALAVFRSAETVDEMTFLVNNMTWEEIDDELDEDAVTQVAKHFLWLLDVKEHVVAALLRRIFPFKLEDLGGLPAGTTANIVNSFALPEKQALATELLGMRDRLLDSIAIVALRGNQGFVDDLKVVFDSLIAAAPSSALSELRWEVHYTSDICTRVERGDVGPLASALITLVNPSVAAPQRNAFYAMLRRWEKEFRAFEEVVRVLGTPNQRGDMADFMSKRQLFLDQPLGSSASPGAIAAALQAILDALGIVSGGFESLKTALGTLANSIEVISTPDVLDNQQDDKAVAATDLLTGLGLLAHVSYRYKMKFTSDLLDGGTDSEDEQAILRTLRASKGRSPAEFMQLVTAASWEKLSFSIDGDEYEELEGMFTF